MAGSAAVTSLRQLRSAAETAPSLLLLQQEAHPAGVTLGLVSVALGIWLSEGRTAAAEFGGWLALAGVVAGMALYLRWKTEGVGWQIDFARRIVAPVRRQTSTATAVDGAGYSIRTGPGHRFPHMAIDLCHADRGLVARLFDRPAWRRGDRRQISVLADTLARRLAVERSGVRY